MSWLDWPQDMNPFEKFYSFMQINLTDKNFVDCCPSTLAFFAFWYFLWDTVWIISRIPPLNITEGDHI